jgi:hypothetical protein
MSLLGVIAILMSFAGLSFCSARPSQGRSLWAIAMILLHLAASFAYYAYAQSNPSDATLYYYDPYHFRSADFELSTVFVVKLVYALRTVVGGTFLDYFLLFQVPGIWGILLLYRTFQEVHDQLGQKPSQLSYALLLFPGLHFWTSALGKDAPVFFAISLAVWAAIRLPKRVAAFAVAIGLMVLFRPHVALVATVTIAVTAFFDSRSNKLAKVVLLAIALVGTSYVALSVKNTFSVDVTSANSIGDFLADQQQKAQNQTGGTMVRDASFPVRLISLLFRPMFIDANGLFALIASLENLFTVFLVGFMLFNWKESFWLMRRVFFLRFTLLFAVSMILLLTLVYYNVGLGSRQKVMMYPAFFAFFVAQWAYHRQRIWQRRNSTPAEVHPLDPRFAAQGPR